MTSLDGEKLHNEQRTGAKTCFRFLMIHVGSGSSEQHLEGTTAKRLVISLLVTGEKWLSCAGGVGDVTVEGTSQVK